ncbi:MAG TPA: ABC-F family ATP-binding cassette domain-containing protein [Candidatus Deferrimicrobiaceae bacterium]|nr:ABC-F family ATP-binding cassette domain-containing protein [Candidatus Deferrimicrobiaceae bacterium]
MLTVTNLSKAYGKQTLFDGVSFQVAPGERVGVVGRNGAGKSTLFRILLGEEASDEGTVSVPSGYRIGHLAQHLRFRHRTSLEEAASALPRAEDGTDETYRAKVILSGLGFSESDLSRSPNDLSGGFQVRLNLARVLLSDCNLLLLDEPTNYLDVVSIRWLQRFLRAWKGELLLITHDRGFMDSVTTHTMAIHRRRVRKLPGGTEKIYQQILQEERIHEQTRINDERRRKEAEAFISRFRAQATKARAVQSRIKALARHERLEKLARAGDLDFSFRAAPFPGKWMLEARDLAFGYDPRRPLIEGLSLAVERRDRIAVVGANGRGKTTLLRLLAGELAPVSGTVRPALNLKIGYFGQTNVDRLNPGLSVEEEVRQANPAFTRTQVRTLCGAMMFEGSAAEKKISVLSGGERSRVLLARILAAPVNLLLLDEPTNHLDQESVDAFLEAVSAFEGAVVIVTHVERVLSALATKLVVFDRGKAERFDGGYADFLERVGWQAEATEAAPLPVAGEFPARRRDLRRQRAEVVARRSKELGRLRRAIAALETEIMALEAQLAKDDAAIVEATRKNDGTAVRALASAASAARVRIEALFDERTVLGEELRQHERDAEAEPGFSPG